MNCPNSNKTINISCVKNKFFSDPKKILRIKKGEILIEEGKKNERLFLVITGLLGGYGENPSGVRFELFKAYPNMLLGVYSFFSMSYKSSATIIADEDSELKYIQWDEIGASEEDKLNFKGTFMPLVLAELLDRQEWIEKISLEKEQALKKLVHSEKMASLGQMAAGIAHELNNSVSVLKSNAGWLGENISSHLKGTSSDYLSIFHIGLDKGRYLSSMMIRRKAEYLKKVLAIPSMKAKKLAQTGLESEKLQELVKNKQLDLDTIFFHWEIGAIIYDMIAAANQSSHVVRSVKSLGRPEQQIIHEAQDINETIHIAISLLRNSLKKLTLQTNLTDLPPILISKGEMIQVWVNLLKNAYESIESHDLRKGEITISSYIKKNTIYVHIEDNGSGIPPDKIGAIFQPNITTKVSGLSFGLGLGLSIVERILENNKGKITVSSIPGKTIFTVSFIEN